MAPGAMTFLKAGALSAALVIAVYAGLFTWRAGLVAGGGDIGPQDCQRRGDLLGPEDVAVDFARGQFWLPRADRHAVLAGTGGPAGALYRLDTEVEGAQPAVYRPLAPETFFPHGLGLWVDPETEARRLFVVNHGAEYRDSRIEIFRIEDNNRLTHLETIRDPAITRPNDVAPIGPRQFFVTNDLGGWTPFWRSVEPYLMAPWASLVFYDGQAGRRVRTGLRYANGVTVDRDAGRLYLAESMGRQVTAFRLSTDPGGLDRLWRRGVGMAVDNLTLSPAGRLLATGHPKALAFTAHAANPKRPSPSRIVAFDRPATPSPAGPTVIWQDDGRDYPGASVAQQIEDRLYVGGIYVSGLLICPAPANAGA